MTSGRGLVRFVPRMTTMARSSSSNHRTAERGLKRLEAADDCAGAQVRPMRMSGR